ncbi:MAG: hypothetical protein GW903_06090 [Alphaproteobacteria bacterium]|nr:hypothetical protein [Alphaproteobacteria bacterium]NCQ88450.1 hypothetical protein [Alphaproteobacteria bacterium]
MILKHKNYAHHSVLDKNLKQSGNVFLALFGAVAVVGLIGGTAAGIMKGPMKAMSDVSARAKSENEIMANTKMAVMAIANIDKVNPGINKDCDNDGIIEAYPYSAARIDTVGPAPIGGGYLPSEIDTTRWIDAWGNSYTYCVWDHGTLIDDASCGGAGQNRLQGFDTGTYPPADVNKQTFIAILSAGPNRRYETSCQDWSAADANANGVLGDSGDTSLVLKPNGSDDIVMSYTYAEAAMATSSNWRIASGTTDTAEIPEEDIEVGGNTSLGEGVKTTIAGGVEVLGGLKLATDPGDDTMTGACNPANDQALRINTGGSIDVLEICASGLWQPVSSTSVSAQGCAIETINIANSGSAWIQNGTRLYKPQTMAIKDNYAYVVSELSDSLTVIDISNPLAPVIANSGNAWIQSATRLDGAKGIAIKGNYAYVTASRLDAITVIDISNPLVPVIANSGNAWVQDATKLDSPNRIAISGNYAYVASYNSDSLTVIDISNPLVPVIANSGNAWVQDAVKLNGAINLKISGNYAYVAANIGNAITIIDISNPLAPSIANGGNAWIQDATKLDGIKGISIKGNYAYASATDANAITVIDISNPLVPVIAKGGNAWIQDATKLNSPHYSYIYGDYLYVPSLSGNSLTIVNLKNPIEPVIANSANAWVQDAVKLNGAYQAFGNGRYAYITSEIGDSFTVIDLNCDPEREEALSGYDVGYDAKYANCIAGNNGPAALQARLPIAGLESVYSDKEYIYTTSSNGITKALSFDGYTLTEIADYTVSGGSAAHGIWGDGKYIFVSRGNVLTALIFDGTSFSEINTITLGSQIYNLWDDGEYLYVSNNFVGMHALRFDGNTFTLLATAPSFSFKVWGDEKYIFNTHFSGNIDAYTFDGNSFNLEATINVGSNRDIFSNGEYIFAATGGNSIKAYSFDGTSFSEVASRGGISIAYNITGDGRYLYLAGNEQTHIYSFDGEEFTEHQRFGLDGAEQMKIFHDGSTLLVPTSTELYAFTGFECTKAGLKTSANAIAKDYNTNQFITQSNDTGLVAETYGTSILLDSGEFGDEAGVAFNVSSVLGDNEIPSATITAIRKSELDDATALIFKTQDDDNKLKTRMAIDSNGNLGLNTSLPYDVSANIQIGDIASNDTKYFNPEIGNCSTNNSGPFSELVTTNGAALTGASDIWTDDKYVYVARGAEGFFIYTFDGVTFSEVASDVSFNATSIIKHGAYLYVGGSGVNGLRVYSFDGTTLTAINTIGGIPNITDIVHDGEFIYTTSYTTPGQLIAFSFDGTTLTERGRYNDGIRNSLRGIVLHNGYIVTGYVNSNDVVAFTFDGTKFTEKAVYTAFQPNGFWSDQKNIYVANTFQGLDVLTLENDSFSLVYDGPASTPRAQHVWSDGVSVYANNDATGTIGAYTFDGTTLTLQSSIAGAGYIWGDGNYIYTASPAGGVRVYSGFECTKTKEWLGPDQGLLASDPEILGFNPDASNCTVNESGPGYLVDSIAIPNGFTGIWADNDYVYTQRAGLRAYSFDGEKLELKSTFASAETLNTLLWGDESYIYAGAFGAYTFNEETFTQIDTINTSSQAGAAWSDGQYIYIANNTNGIRVMGFDGTTLSFIASDPEPVPYSGAGSITGDGTYIYVSDESQGIHAYTFNGSALTRVGTFDTPDYARGVHWANGYIFVADGNFLRAYSFDGSNFTSHGSYDIPGLTYDVFADGLYVYATGSNGITVLTFNGTAFSFVETLPTNVGPRGVWGNGKYIFTTDSSRLYMFGGYGCLETAESVKGAIGYFGLESETNPKLNILYSTGLDIKGTNISGDTQTDILNIDANGTTTISQNNLNIQDEAAAFNFLTNSNNNIFNTLEINRYRGDSDAGTIVQNGDLIGGLIWGGYSGDATDPTDHAAIYAKVNGSVSPNNIPLDLILSTDSAGSALNSSDITISSTGNIGINTDNPAWPLHSNGRISVDEGFRVGFDSDCSTGRDLAFLRYNGATLSLEHCGGDGNWSHISQPIREFAKIDPTAPNCLKNNGGPFQEIASDGSKRYNSITSDGTYYYYGSSDAVLGNTLVAATFNGTSFDEIHVFDFDGNVTGIIAKNGYLYVGAQWRGIQIFTFNGSTLTQIDIDSTYFANNIFVTDDYIFTIGDEGPGIRYLRASRFNGTTITNIAGITIDRAAGVTFDGTYLHVAQSDSGLYAYSFDGTTFTQIADYEGGAGSGGGNRKQHIQYVNGYIFLSEEFSGITMLSFNGTNYTELDTYNSWGFLGAGPQAAGYVWSDGIYYYTETSAYGGASTERDFIHAFTFDGTTLTPYAHIQKTVNSSDSRQGRLNGYGSFIFDSTGNAGMNVFAGFECLVADNPGEQIIDWTGAQATEIKVISSDGATNDFFGASTIGLSGSYALISARADDDNGDSSGSVYVYDIKTGAEIHKLTATDGEAFDFFGYAVALDGSNALVSARQDDDMGSNSGSAYIFDVLTGDQRHKLLASDGLSNDFFGDSVALSGNYAAIGAGGDDNSNGNSAGAVYIFNTITGEQIHKLLAKDGANVDLFGHSISLYGDYAVIGAPYDDDIGAASGSAYIFNIKTGEQIHKLIANDGAPDDRFGYAVSINGKYAIAGAYWHDHNGIINAGAAYIFDIITGAQVQKLIADDAIANAVFGQNVSISGEYAVVGAPSDNQNGSGSGSIYIFDIASGEQIKKLTASDGAPSDSYGTSIQIENSTIIVGALRGNGNVSDSGSAYIYRGNWDERFRAETACFPDPMFFDDISGAISNTDITTQTITVKGFVNGCPLSLSSESGTIDIIKNTVSVGASQTTVNSGDTIQLQIRASATAGASFNNILTLGDERAMFSVTTAP